MNPHTVTSNIEKRRRERISIPFPATVEGVDTDGEEFKIDTVIDNLSNEGLYLRMIPCVEIGSKLLVVFRLSSAARQGQSTPRILVRGNVLRVEEFPGGACGIALKFAPAKFIGN